MPLYDLRCPDCKLEKEVLVRHQMAVTLELVCVACGGTMIMAPVRMRSKVYGKSGKPGQKLAPSMARARQKAKSCGHGYQCRCAIKLSSPNPFKKEVQAAMGKAEQD
jgi:ribosomal protein S27E